MTVATPAAGFADPVQHSQRTFRALLDAMSRPGRIIRLADDTGHPAGLAPALAATLLTLCDLDTPVWFGPGLQGAELAHWLRFHTGAPVVRDPGQAAVAVLAADQVGSLEQYAFGSDEAPERGATLLIQTPGLQDPPATTWSGPGLREPMAMPLFGLPEPVWRQRAALSAAFPRGLDIYLACGCDLIGLPRSTTISMTGA